MDAVLSVLPWFVALVMVSVPVGALLRVRRGPTGRRDRLWLVTTVLSTAAWLLLFRVAVQLGGMAFVPWWIALVAFGALVALAVLRWSAFPARREGARRVGRVAVAVVQALLVVALAGAAGVQTF